MSVHINHIIIQKSPLANELLPSLTMHWWRSHQSFGAWFVSIKPHLFKWNSFDNIRHVNIFYPIFSQSYCSELILPQPLQCDRWWSPVFHEGNIWGHPPHSRLWRQWPPASSCSGCCSFSELRDSELWREKTKQYCLTKNCNKKPIHTTTWRALVCWGILRFTQYVYCGPQ